MRDASPSPIASTLARRSSRASTSRNRSPALPAGETSFQLRPPSVVRSTSPALPPTQATRADTASSPRYCWSEPVGTGFQRGGRWWAAAVAGRARASKTMKAAPVRMGRSKHIREEGRMFDYVIVGAGSAGCVLANRLSEDPDTSVLLVEAGPPDSEEGLHIPVAFSQLYKTPFDWDFSTEPEPALDGRNVYLPRGRVLGGSSSLNAMVYIRGNRRDYDEWRDLGNAGWGWDDVLPYFKRAEDNERGASEFHGAGGPLSVSDSHSMHPLADAFVEAAAAAGMEKVDDFNTGEQDGVGRYQVTQRNGM